MGKFQVQVKSQGHWVDYNTQPTITAAVDQADMVGGRVLAIEGETYDLDSLSFDGFSDEREHEELNWMMWFDSSCYLGPDIEGLEPLLTANHAALNK
jgi:hypothetical protein